jgi:PIN domain nuclease of toxin-antitoxin system
LAKPVVLDASAVLAVLFDEPGASEVIDLLHGGLLSTVNLAEIQSQLLLAGRPSVLAWNRVLSMGFEVVFFSEEHARLAGELAEKLIGDTRQPKALSLGDRACLALAIERNATAYTTNRAWKNLPLDLDIVVVG